jgi:Superoxide dismutase
MAFKKYTAINWDEANPAIFKLDGISERSVREHIKLYNGYVAKYNEVQEMIENLSKEELSKANPTYSLIRSLKVELTRAIGGIKNHEIYFFNLGGKGRKPSGDLLKRIEEDFGSYERFEDELRATAIAARGWAWVAYDFDFDRLFIAIGDEQNTYPFWNAYVILALDAFEHAFFMDYGTNKAGYIDAYFMNLNWEDVEKRYEKALKIRESLKI